MDTPALIDSQKFIHQFCVNAGCRLEDLPTAIANRDGCCVCVCVCEREGGKERGRQGNLCYQHDDDYYYIPFSFNFSFNNPNFHNIVFVLNPEFDKVLFFLRFLFFVGASSHSKVGFNLLVPRIHCSFIYTSFLNIR